LNPPVSPDERGVAHVTNARWDAVDVTAAKDERSCSRTAKSCGPGAAVLALNSRKNIREMTVATKPFTGEITK
jgi:hypothetical protein